MYSESAQPRSRACTGVVPSESAQPASALTSSRSVCGVRLLHPLRDGVLPRVCHLPRDLHIICAASCTAPSLRFLPRSRSALLSASVSAPKSGLHLPLPRPAPARTARSASLQNAPTCTSTRRVIGRRAVHGARWAEAEEARVRMGDGGTKAKARRRALTESQEDSGGLRRPLEEARWAHLRGAVQEVRCKRCGAGPVDAACALCGAGGRDALGSGRRRDGGGQRRDGVGGAATGTAT